MNWISKWMAVMCVVNGLLCLVGTRRLMCIVHEKEQTLFLPETKLRRVASQTKHKTRTAPRIPQGRPSRFENTRILLYITTHLSPLHVAFFKHCWPNAIANSALLSSHVDVMVFLTGGDYSTALNVVSSVFPKDTNVSVKAFKNQTLQAGAMSAMREGFAESNKNWFEGYDWIIRLNPDVIIRNDTWIQKTLLDDSVNAIFIDCFDGAGDFVKIHTDFFAIRPRAVPRNAFQKRFVLGDAEDQASLDENFGQIVKSGKARFLEGAGPQEGWCRVKGKDSPVIHDHRLLRYCEEEYR